MNFHCLYFCKILSAESAKSSVLTASFDEFLFNFAVNYIHGVFIMRPIDILQEIISEYQIDSQLFPILSFKTCITSRYIFFVLSKKEGFRYQLYNKTGLNYQDKISKVLVNKSQCSLKTGQKFTKT